MVLGRLHEGRCLQARQHPRPDENLKLYGIIFEAGYFALDRAIVAPPIVGDFLARTTVITSVTKSSSAVASRTP